MLYKESQCRNKSVWWKNLKKITRPGNQPGWFDKSIS